MEKTVKLKRDVNAIQVPFGTSKTLPKGTEVTITFSLGGSHTVVANSNMYRIDNENADAIGKNSLIFDHTEYENVSLEDKIWSQLHTCYDPEIPVNIVDLGLIYRIDVAPTTEKKDKFNVKIWMTITSPGCGMGPIITEDARQKVLRLPEIKNVEIEMVFDPPWDRSMLSEQAKLELGLL